MFLEKSVDFIKKFKTRYPESDKYKIQKAWVDWASPEKVRSVFVTDNFAIRFCEANTRNFSNTVLSLSTLSKYDMNPFVVTVVKPCSVNFLLANTSFLKKISHSSQQLRLDNIKGSFNGTDIMMDIEGVTNTPENFNELFALHSSFAWKENLERLVEATNQIVARNDRFQPSTEEQALILEAPVHFSKVMRSHEYAKIERDLIAQMKAIKYDILKVTKISNVNIRGNKIEQLITNQTNSHQLGDMVLPLSNDTNLVIDIKTKLLDHISAPKAYNVDKFLRLLAQPGSVLAFFMIGVKSSTGEVSGRLLTCLDDALRNSTVVQHHWAGRGSRGVTQLSGKFDQLLSSNYHPSINIRDAREFLTKLINL